VSIGSIIASILGWVIGRLVGKGSEKKAEEKYAEAKKENLELHAENAGLLVRKEVEDSEAGVRKKWEEAEEKGDAHSKYEILKRDFNGDD